MALTARKRTAVKDLGQRDQDGHDFYLTDGTGKQVLLSFHPLAWAPGSARQARPSDESRKALDRFDAVSLGLSSDRVCYKPARARSQVARTTKLVSESWPHGAFAKSLGVLQVEGVSERAWIILDESGQIMSVLVCSIRQLPDTRKSWRR